VQRAREAKVSTVTDELGQERRKLAAGERKRERREARRAFWAERQAQKPTRTKLVYKRDKRPETAAILEARRLIVRAARGEPVLRLSTADTEDSLSQTVASNPSPDAIHRAWERIRARGYYAANKHEIQKRSLLKRDNDPIGVAVKRMLASARTRARKNGGICTITETDIRRLVKTHCPALLIEIETNTRPLPNSMTLDRIVPDLWYIPGNIAVISQRANLIKQDATAETLLRIADRLGTIPTEPGPLDSLRIPWGKSCISYKAALIYHARERAVCTLQPNDFVIPEFCPLLGIKLEREKMKLGRASPSLDRMDSTLGYVPGNVAVISVLANRIKQNASRAELLAVGQWLKREEERIKTTRKE